MTHTNKNIHIVLINKLCKHYEILNVMQVQALNIKSAKCYKEM